MATKHAESRRQRSRQTADEWQRLVNQIGFLAHKADSFEARILCSVLRRCRDLEERDRQAAAAYAAKCETQRYLEAEIERLKNKKCPHDLARDFSKETTSGY